MAVTPWPTPQGRPSPRPDLLSHLRWPVRLTRGGMVAERATRAFWPLWSILFLALAPLMMGWQDLLAVELVWAWAVLAVLGAGAALVFVRFAWPALGHRTQNLAVALLVVGSAGLLSLVFPAAWRLGAAWLATALLLQWSHVAFVPGRLVWSRAALAAALTVGGARLIGI